ncbi:MAG: DUF4254 domain-containing protein [Bacteroidetes bacterium]|nr:DUF4254 domain-containing protein [Bacteroidota bacterium]
MIYNEIIDMGKIIAYHNKFCLLWHHDATVEWHERIEFNQIHTKILEEHKVNFNLWHKEDIARRMDVSEKIIVDAKRAIDKLNQLRNDLIEEIDRLIIEAFKNKNVTFNDFNVPQNSETIGSILDRLSIISLKIYHMAEQTQRKDVKHDHLVGCFKKLEILKNQRDDLVLCVEQLIADCLQGKKRIKTHYQFKMYNDPSLNPELYQQQEIKRSN